MTTWRHDGHYSWLTTEDGTTVSYVESEGTFWKISPNDPAHVLPERVSSLEWTEAGGEHCGANIGAYGACIAPKGHWRRHCDASGHRFDWPANRARDGVLITEIDNATAYVATADGMGYGPRFEGDFVVSSALSTSGEGGGGVVTFEPGTVWLDPETGEFTRSDDRAARQRAATISLRGVQRLNSDAVYSELRDWYEDGSKIISDRAALSIVIGWSEAGFLDSRTYTMVSKGYEIDAGDFLRTVLAAYAHSLRYVSALRDDLHGVSRYGLVALAAWIADRAYGRKA